MKGKETGMGAAAMDNEEAALGKTGAELAIGLRGTSNDARRKM